jgi:hypothetical protein
VFFDTPFHLLRPIHSLLKQPFSFKASASFGNKLRNHLDSRKDFQDLLDLANLFDRANETLKPSLVSLRSRLEQHYSLLIPEGSDFSGICRSEFSGPKPNVLGMDGARYICHVSLQCQLERLYDLFDLRQAGRKNPLELSECVGALKVLMLSEALALTVAGVATVNYAAGRFKLSVNSQTVRDTLRRTWFARIADQYSHAATLALAAQLAKKGAAHLHDVEVLTERILEQDLSLPWHRISSGGRSLASVKQIHAAAGVVALLAVLGMRNESLRLSGPELSQRGLDFSVVSSLIRRQQSALVSDQFIKLDDGLLSVRVDSASKGMRSLFRTLETEFGEHDLLGVHLGGKFYEQTHIRQRIEQGEDYRGRYRIFDGFDRGKIVDGAPNECDVEYIIHDYQQSHYYFIQAKHALLGEKAFFESVIEAIQKDIGKGLHQLREAKRLLDNGKLDATLKARGINDATGNNCTFVLLHNIAQLDFQKTADGISLYDWASFRNLLKDAECSFGHSDGFSARISLPTPLVVTDPTAVIQRLLDEHPAYKQLYADPWAQERAKTSYDVLGSTIELHGLGI